MKYLKWFLGVDEVLLWFFKNGKGNIILKSNLRKWGGEV
jgi:hypothetical protein